MRTIQELWEEVEPTLPDEPSCQLDTIVQVSGIISSIRIHGKKLAFLDIMDKDTEKKVQIVLELSNTKPPAEEPLLSFFLYNSLLLPDSIVEVSGIPSRSSTKFFSLVATQYPTITKLAPQPFAILRALSLLSRQLLPLPIGAQALQITDPFYLDHLITSFQSPHFNRTWRLCVQHARQMQNLPPQKLARIRPPKLTYPENLLLTQGTSTLLTLLSPLSSSPHPSSPPLSSPFPSSPSLSTHLFPSFLENPPLSAPEVPQSAKLKWGLFDPILNLPNQKDQDRIDYVNKKKKPQIEWIVSRLRQLHSTQPHVYIDVGGGRGDLALLIAREFPISRVLVVDKNEVSLENGKRRAEELRLGNISFFCKDVRDLVLDMDFAKDRVCFLGLHACGGLSEFLMAFAASLRADFLVCTCCFNSNRGLSCLLPAPLKNGEQLEKEERRGGEREGKERGGEEREGEGRGGEEERGENAESEEGMGGGLKRCECECFRCTGVGVEGECYSASLMCSEEAVGHMSSYRRLAEISLAEPSEKAMLIINYWRMLNLQKMVKEDLGGEKWNFIYKDSVIPQGSGSLSFDDKELRLSLLSFPRDYSERNMVIVGLWE